MHTFALFWQFCLLNLVDVAQKPLNPHFPHAAAPGDSPVPAECIEIFFFGFTRTRDKEDWSEACGQLGRQDLRPGMASTSKNYKALDIKRTHMNIDICIYGREASFSEGILLSMGEAI